MCRPSTTSEPFHDSLSVSTLMTSTDLGLVAHLMEMMNSALHNTCAIPLQKVA